MGALSRPPDLTSPLSLLSVSVCLCLPLNVCLDLTPLDGTKEAIDYAVNSVLMALHKQTTRGPFIEENEPELGWFDFVGHDRREAWELLVRVCVYS
jgi:hypothetical protein